MGRVQTPELGRDFFDFLMSDRVAIQDVHSGAMSLGANAKTRTMLWESIKRHYGEMMKKFSGSTVVTDRFMRVSLNKFSDRGVSKDITEFFKDKDVSGFDRSLGVLRDTIEGNAGYKERDEKLIEEWLGARGYL